MKKPKGYDETTAYTYGDSKALPAGGYVCEIRHAEERINRKGGEMLVLNLEIVEGDFSGYFAQKFDAKRMQAAPGAAVNYPGDGTAYINTTDADGNCSRSFKGFTTALEDSGGKFEWGDRFTRNITGAKIGAVFGREEREFNGHVFWSCKAKYFVGVDRIRAGEYKTPEDKPLEKHDELAWARGGAAAADPAGRFSNIEEDLPF